MRSCLWEAIRSALLVWACYTLYVTALLHYLKGSDRETSSVFSEGESVHAEVELFWKFTIVSGLVDIKDSLLQDLQLVSCVCRPLARNGIRSMKGCKPSAVLCSTKECFHQESCTMVVSWAQVNVTQPTGQANLHDKPKRAACTVHFPKSSVPKDKHWFFNDSQSQCACWWCMPKASNFAFNMNTNPRAMLSAKGPMFPSKK